MDTPPDVGWVDGIMTGSVARFVAEQRNKQILGHAQPYLDDGEEILYWARARHPDAGRRGYLFLTDRRCLVHWSGRSEGRRVVPWEDIRTWGIDAAHTKGPMLGIETRGRERVFVHMPVSNHSTAQRATTFLERFSTLAPEPNGRIHRANHEGHFDSFRGRPVPVQERSMRDHVKRIIVTVLGLVLSLGGIIITPLPGPWTIPIVVAGLALLASEYDWAEDALNWVREKYHRFRDRRSSARVPPPE